METTPLRKARLKRGISIRELANATGVDRGNLWRIERGRAGLSPETAAKLAAYFDGELTELEILYPQRFQDRSAA